MNTPVNFELAKLLKEKGYDIPSLKCYLEDSSVQISSGDEGDFEEYNHNQWDNYSAPTIVEVVMWLYEKHGIWISLDWMTRIKPYNSGFISHLRGTNKRLNQDNFIVINDTLKPGYEVFNSPTEAYEAAIEYTLNNLI